MKFHTKLYVGFGMVLLMACVISLLTVITMNRINGNMGVIVHDKYAKVRLATDLRNNFVLLDRTIYDAFIDSEYSNRELDEISQLIADTKESSNALIQQLVETVYLPSGIQLLNRIRSLYTDYFNSLNKSMIMLRNGQIEDASQIVNSEFNDIRRELDSEILDFKSIQENEMEITLSDASSSFHTSVIITIILVAILLIACLGIAIWSVSTIRSSLRQVTNVLHSVKDSDSETLPRISIRTKDEIGSIAEAFNHMADSLEEKTKQQKKHAAELVGQHWVKSMVAEITKGYQGIDDVTELARWFITKVTPLVGANYGVFYLREDHFFTKKASYAADGENIGKIKIQLGEGLIGQCASEKRMVILDHPPADYIRIKSGIGDAPPSQIIIIPVFFKEFTEGVIELASFRKISEQEMTLLQELIETLGVTIYSILGQMQVQKLLKESQVFTEELQTQSEELQQQQEELTTLNEKLSDQFKQAEQKNKELEILKADLESKNEQLVLASKYKSEFLANISHELRTPLNSVLVLSQILATNTDHQLSDKQIEYVQTIYSSGNELLKLINEILDLSKIESGKMDVVFEETHLGDLVNSITRHFKVTAESKGISFQVHFDPSLEQITLRTDGQKLQQIIKNLLSNAMKFTNHGDVTLTLSKVRIDSVEKEFGLAEFQEWIAFEIKDTGIGISAEKLELIFESFQQADGTTSRKYGGTGLGLAISKQLVELLKGSIHVTSEEGKGSVFTVYVPMTSQTVIPKLSSNHRTPETEADNIHDIIVLHTSQSAATIDNQLDNNRILGKKILLVDDDMRNIYALTSALENYGLQIVFAENGEEGLQMLQEHPDTDLILMDIMMPKMDGYQAIRIIRESSQFSDLPIIALTAKAMKEDREKCIEAGANDYISKPIHIEQLLSLIHVWLYRLD